MQKVIWQILVIFFHLAVGGKQSDAGAKRLPLSSRRSRSPAGLSWSNWRCLRTPCLGFWPLPRPTLLTWTHHCSKELDMTCRQISCCLRLAKDSKKKRWTSYNYYVSTVYVSKYEYSNDFWSKKFIFHEVFIPRSQFFWRWLYIYV